jgi:hypothetical protein
MLVLELVFVPTSVAFGGVTGAETTGAETETVALLSDGAA